MTRRRWIADEISGNRAALTGAHAAHLANVLRARLGQEFDVSIGTAVRSGRIISITPDRVEFELGEEISATPAPEIILLLSIFKFDRMEWAMEKCTELGVAQIVPVVAKRSDAHLISAAGKRVERWRRIARQASEQARRQFEPEISDSVKLRDALALGGAGIQIVLAESECKLTIKAALESHSAGSTVALALGPEGGWTDAEMQLFRENGWVAASLGNTILRAETAAIAAVAITLSALAG